MKNVKKYILAALLLTLFLTGCSSTSSNTYTGISYFYDITPNDEAVIFSYYKNNKGTIYEYNFESKKTSEIIADKNLSFTTLSLSKDGKTIYALAQEKKDSAPTGIYSIDRESGESTKLYDTKNENYYLTGLTVAKDNDQLFFLQSSTYGEEEPVSGKMPHGFDLYSLTTDGDKAAKLTNQSMYIAESLRFDEAKNRLLFSAYELENKEDDSAEKDEAEEQTDIYSSKIYSYDISKKTLTQVYSQVSSKTATGDLYTPAASANGKYAAFSGVTAINDDNSLTYEIFINNEANDKVTIATNTSSAYSPVFFNQTNKIFFSNRATDEEDAKYFIYDLKSKETKEVTITID